MTTPAQDLFAQAHDLDPSAREAFLAQACGEDAELRLEVQRLLVDAERAQSFFSDEDGATLGAEEFADSYTEKEGDLVGPYKLRQQIGEGGFGVVWMAEQSKPISRMVALKVIKAGMDTKQVLARFEAERQAVAMMDHPNIAKVLDAGATSTGRPFFAMELIKGIPITQFCDESGLGTPDRLALFGDVCSAINHAHQKGIIHRDIKPSNVMVTLHGDKPVVKVIDFGIAKATQGKLTDQTLFTRFEQFIGTPVYMSPEQASLSGLDIDTRSDIYALGILLYELLVGKPPFEAKSLVSAGYDEMRRIIREVEPMKPSSRLSTVLGEERTALAKSHRIDEAKLDRLVEPDLDWIVMKAIDKDRSRRYETANAFAQDIVRFLADEPVTATPPKAGYKFKKFARRNKTAFGVAAAMVMLLLAGIAATSWQAVRATAESERAIGAEKKATETLALVAAERDAKTAALEDAKATSKFLTDMFASSRPGEEKGGRDVKVADVLDRAAEQLDADAAMPPKRRAALQWSLGDTYHALGLYPKAIPLQEKVHDYNLATYGPEHPYTLNIMAALAISYSDSGRRAEALEMREKVLVLSRKVLGPEHPDTLSAMGNLALSYAATGRRAEAIEMGEEALVLRRKLNGREHPNTLIAMINLANSYNDAGRKDEALKMREELLPLFRKEFGTVHPHTLKAMTNLAISYGAAGRHDKALELFEQVLASSHKVNGPEHPDTLRAMGNFTMSAQAVASGMLWDGKTSDYHALTRKLLELIATSEKVEPLRRVAKIASLAPHPDAKVRQAVLAPAQKVRDLDEKRSVWTPMVLGMALFRNGEHAEAAQVLKNDSVGGHVGGTSAYYRAMSLFQQERQDDARSLFTAAEAVMKPLPVAGEDITQMSSDNLILWLAYKEAGTLLSLPLQKIPKAVKEVLIPPTSEWKWLHPLDGTDPAEGDPDFHQTFFTTGFDDATWQTGKDSAEAGGGFGYGEDWFTGVDIGTPSSKELGKSAYFRHRFTTTREHTNLELRCQRDDGLIIYLDGKVVARDNMEEGEEAYHLPAASAVSKVNEKTTYRIPLPGLSLPAGEHILSISLHNPAKPSSDLRIGGITLVEVDPPEAK